MQPRLVVDSFCEFSEILRPWTIAEFWNDETHDFIPGAIYLVESQHFVEDGLRLRQEIELGKSRFVFSLPFEGSETLQNHLYQYGIADLVKSGKLLLIAGGDMRPEWPHITYDMFATKFHDFEENINEAQRSTKMIYEKTDKPYKFLFLNGRERAHRKYLIEKFDIIGLLDSAIWSSLSPVITPSRDINLWHQDVNRMYVPRNIKKLPIQYEVPRYRDSCVDEDASRFVKMDLFKDEWGDIYVSAEPYIDTYFSLITETVFESPYSFRTEKLWKPMAMCHPFIVAANQGYYRDLHDLGFRTFGNLIDESFDAIENNQDRIERIVEVVRDLCDQDLPAFLAAAQDTCKYNQQHLTEYRVSVKRDFPERFFDFLRKHQWMT